ncbi:MAG: hypothetical protein ACRC8S_22540 [Fimbriiglobus sp.]
MSRTAELEDEPEPFPRWRIVFGSVTLITMILIGWVFGALWNAGWFVQVPREFEATDLGCKLIMPGAVHDSQMIKDFDGNTQYAVRRRYPWESFGLAAREISLRTIQSRADQHRELDKVLKEFATPLGEAKFTDGNETNYPTREFQLAHPRYGTVIARAYLVGSRVFLLCAAGRKVTAEREDVKKFFDSLVITDQSILAEAAKEAKRIKR